MEGCFLFRNMDKFYYTLLLMAFLFTGCKKDNYEVSLNQDVLIETAELRDNLEAFAETAKTTRDTKILQEYFAKCRHQYKKTEWALEYFVPDIARFINGPALDELELEENREFPPHGFQVIEELLFPEYDDVNKEELIREINILVSNILIVEKHLSGVTISPDYAMDALSLEVYRIITLGITGFDSPIAQASVPETAIALGQIPLMIEKLQKGNKTEALVKDISAITGKAVAFCKTGDFNSFNRAAFITGYLNPLSKKLAAFQKAENIPAVARNRVLRAEAAYLFDEDAFDADAFIPSSEYAFSREKALLGEKLFYDASLSKANDRSCATCHNPDKAFTDGLKTNFALSGTNLKRNTPTLTYAAFQHGFFWDLRQPDLEKQSLDVIENVDEMHGSMATIVPKISADVEYQKLFRKAFDTDKPEAWQVQNALASYVRTLNKFNSRFDKFMRGDNSAMSRDEINGMNIFMGKAKCATCHFVPLFNGTVPPNFAKTEHEVVGTPKDAAGTVLSDDEGRYRYNKMPQLKNAYKTPGLRNAALTAPYMHNGVYKTLEEVVDFYNKGGGKGLGLPIDNQTLPFDKLSLTDKEMKDLVAFMKALSDDRAASK